MLSDSDKLHELSKQLSLPASYLQSLPMHQIVALREVLSKPPRFIENSNLSSISLKELLTAYNISLTAKDVLFKVVISAIANVIPNIYQQQEDMQRLLKAVSRSPATGIIDMTIFISAWTSIINSVSSHARSSQNELTSRTSGVNLLRSFRMEGCTCMHIFDSALLLHQIKTVLSRENRYISEKLFIKLVTHDAAIKLTNEQLLNLKKLLMKYGVWVVEETACEVLRSEIDLMTIFSMVYYGVNKVPLESVLDGSEAAFDAGVGSSASSNKGSTHSHLQLSTLISQISTTWPYVEACLRRMIKVKYGLQDGVCDVRAVNRTKFMEAFAACNVPITDEDLIDLWRFLVMMHVRFTDADPSLLDNMTGAMLTTREIESYLFPAADSPKKVNSSSVDTSVNNLMRDVAPPRLRGEGAPHPNSLKLEWSERTESVASDIPTKHGLPWESSKLSTYSNVYMKVRNRVLNLSDGTQRLTSSISGYTSNRHSNPNELKMFLNALLGDNAHNNGFISRGKLVDAFQKIGVRLSKREVDDLWTEATNELSFGNSITVFADAHGESALSARSFLNWLGLNADELLNRQSFNSNSSSASMPPPPAREPTPPVPPSVIVKDFSNLKLGGQAFEGEDDDEGVSLESYSVTSSLNTSVAPSAVATNGSLISTSKVYDRQNPSIVEFPQPIAAPYVPQRKQSNTSAATRIAQNSGSTVRSLISHGEPNPAPTLPPAAPSTDASDWTTERERSLLITMLNKNRPSLAFLFRRLSGGAIDSTVKAIDFTQGLLTPPISLPLNKVSCWKFVCDMLNVSYKSSPDTTYVDYKGVTAFLDNYLPQQTVVPVEPGIKTPGSQEKTSSESVSYRDSQLLRGIKRKLVDSNSISGNKLKLLSQTHPLRIRLKNMVASSHGRGSDSFSYGSSSNFSWDASPDHCSRVELVRLLQTIDVPLSEPESKFICEKVNRIETADDGVRAGSNISTYDGVRLGAVMLFLSDMLN